MEWKLLDPLSGEERRSLLARARRRRFAKGEVLFHEGDPGDALHLIDKGHVAMRVTTPLGDVATLLVAGAGDFFGELALVSDNATRNTTVVALDPVETLTLHRDQFAELRRDHPAVDRILVVALAEEVRRLSGRLSEALFVPVDKRVYRRLADLVAIYARAGGGIVTIPLTQDDLASMAGTTRPTANKIVKAAEAAGILRIGRGRIEVTDTNGLGKRAR